MALKSFAKSGLVRASACRPRVVRVRAAEPEQPISTSEPTIFYGGKSYTESQYKAAQENGSLLKTDVATAAPMATTSAASSFSITDVMAFGGSAPEIVNGRLAMLGFVAALGAELASGEGVARQWSEEPTGIAFAFVLFMGASLVPLLSGKANSDEMGPFTKAAEMTNGRAAMIGFAALLVIEAVKGSALF